MSDLVYGSYDQENLDLEYDMRRRCPHFAETFATLEPDNARVVEKFKCNLDVPFGDTELQKLDVWPGTGFSRKSRPWDVRRTGRPLCQLGGFGTVSTQNSSRDCQSAGIDLVGHDGRVVCVI